jgi:hypothetical protein
VVIGVFDTRTAAPQMLPLAKNDWTLIPTNTTVDAFKGDAVIGNGRFAAILRQKDACLELHSPKLGAVSKLRLISNDGEPAVSVTRLRLTENGKLGMTLQATFKTAKGTEVSANYRVKRGDVSVQVEPVAGAGRLRVESPGRFVILPDFFADDITLDATKISLDSLDLPSENFMLHPTADGEAIAMCVFENRQQDVKVTLAGKGSGRHVTGSEIGFEKKKIWVAVLDAPQIWHSRDVAAADAGRIINLNWTMPYPAQWRVDFQRTDDITHSWEMLLQERGFASYTRYNWLSKDSEVFAANREHWNTVLGTYSYPVWTDTEGRGYMQPLKSKKLQFAGPAVIYPIHRVKETPLEAFTVVDVMRATLGVGPCEHILDVQAHEGAYKGTATCGVRDRLNPIYTNKQQKALRDEVDKTLDDGLIFVKHVRGRIEDYKTFGKKMQKYLTEQKKAHPELAKQIEALETMNNEIDRRVEARKDKIKTPEHVAKMNEEFRKNVLGYEGPDALERCKAYTHALWVIGDNQDELSGELRWAVRILRQRAGIQMALDPRLAPIATEIRARTQEVLRNPAWHEGARQ